MSKVINIIGAGRLGKTIGKLINIYNAGVIQAVCNSSIESSRNAIDFIGAGRAFTHVSELPPADVTFITTPDDLITEIGQRVFESRKYKPRSTFIHCSGSLTSKALDMLFEEGIQTVSCHPMRSFANPELSIAEFKGTYCALEGTELGIEVAKTIFDSIGGTTYVINPDKKSLYHAAGVISSNYLVTLANVASKCLSEAGVEQEVGMMIITNLMQGTLNNLRSTLSPSDSLTGPIARGDTSTISKHIESMDEETREIYQMLGLGTIELTNHSIEKTSELIDLLANRTKRSDNHKNSAFIRSYASGELS